ncbi:PAS domain-containing protein [Dokdonia ponticola]|uniref:histidine kinase n=1 Tax=Dokdonia ponticola TaxID=2041041 RepID=A0ABV9HZE0_9FLAO
MPSATLNTKILHHIFESSSQATLVLNTEKVVTNSNLAAQKLFGYHKKELENTSLGILIPELVKENISKTNQFIEGLWVFKKDGSQSLVNVQLTNLSDEEGFDTVLFIQDTTDGLIYQWALERSQKDLSHTESEGILGNWYWVFDTDERYWSDEFYRICGLPPGDDRLNTKTALTFIHPDDRKMVMEVINQAIEKNIPYSVEKRIIQPNGSVRNVVARGKVHYNTAGNPVFMSGTMRDITLLKNKQVALLESKRKYKTLINNLNGIVYSCAINLEYTMNYISDGCYAITGYTKDEFLDGSIHFGTIILEEDRSYAWSEVEKALSQKKHFDIQYRIVCKKGSIKYVREIGCGVYNDEGVYTTLEGFITDETEQHRTQAILELRNRALEAAASGIIIADALHPDLPIVYCNKSFTKITGYEKEEILNKNCRFLQNNDRDQAQIKTMSMAIQQSEPCRVTLRNYRKDGTQFWNDLTITPIKDKTGKTTHFIGIQNDITRQKNAELLKDDTRDVLKLITESAELSVIGHKIIEAIENQIPTCATILSVRNRKTDVLEPVSESIEIQPLSKRLYQTESNDLALLHPAFTTNGLVITKNVFDHKRWIAYHDLIKVFGHKSCWSFPIISTQKKSLGVLSIYHSGEKRLSQKTKETITSLIKLLTVAIEKNHSNAELKEKEEQLKAYAHDLEEKVEERTSEVIATVEQLVTTNLHLEDQIQVAQAAEKSADASKSLSLAIAKNFPNGFIIVFDANFEMILKEGEAIDELGLSKVIFDGMSIDDIKIFSKEQKAKLKEDILKTMKGEHLSFEISYMSKYFSVNTTPLIDENGVISSVLFVYSDISQQKRLELDAQNALKKEQELNELKSRFISMASHEFRTPLAAIQTSAILIARQNEPGKEEKREKYVKQIRNNVKNLVIILNDFLSLSKLEEGKVIAKREVFDLISFGKTVIEEVSITANVGQRILFSSSNTELSFNLDPKLLRHILMNLLSNAIKYSPENTTINFNISEDEQCVVLSISDQGIGVPEEEQKKIFERFFRAKNAHNIEGTGLGLNIVKQYVELMDGHIDFASEENKGTTFWIKWLKSTK